MSIRRQDQVRDEIRQGKRFRFGKNWQSFLRTVDERSIAEAERRLIEFLGVSSLSGSTFLDVGSGSGLHSLAARRLGARVLSFDYDPVSVETTRRLRARSGFTDETWQVQQGSALDSAYLATLGRFDVVYSWGVLHHTGAMWDALEKMQPLVEPRGKLYIAIYNDAGAVSRSWLQRKKIYCGLPLPLKPLYFLWIYTPIELEKMNALKSLKRGRLDQAVKKLLKYLRESRAYKKHRGMSQFHDMIDWIGGYPYEFATAEDLVAFYEKAGFRIEKLARNDGTGNHELVFVKVEAP